jgi:hypothetical protein
MVSTYAKEELLNPMNYIIMLITIITFLVALVIIFWFILADYPMKIILSKVDILSLYAQYDPNTKEKLGQKIHDYECSDAIPQTEADKEARIARNTRRLLNNGPILYIVIAFVVLLIITSVLAWNWTHKLEKEVHLIWPYDYFLILLALGGVLVELVLYFVVIENWKFIPDNEIYQILTENLQQ